MRRFPVIAVTSMTLVALGASAGLAASPPVTSPGASPGGGPTIPAKVGAVLSLTKGAAVYGASQQNGLKLGVRDVNDQGAVNIELLVEDDASDPQGGITAFNKLINQDKVVAIIGPTLSNTAASSDPIAQAAGIPVLAISNTAAGITDMGDFIFRDSLTEGQVIPQTIAAVKAKYGLTNVAVMYGQDDAFTKSGYDVFQQALADNGINVTDTETFSKGDKNFNAQLTKIIDGNPEAIVVSALADEGTAILIQARQLGFTGPIVGGNGFNSPAVIANAGPAAEGLVVGAAWNQASDFPESVAFIDAYQTEYGNAPDQFAAQAYAGVQILAAAIERAGSADPTAIRNALTTIDDLPTAIGSFSFTDTRDADAPAAIQIVQGGKFEALQ